MQKNNQIKVLLCSPLEGSIGGISRWAGHVIKYYNSTETNTELKQYYSTSKYKVFPNTSAFVRFYIGVTKYVPFLKGLRKELKITHYDVVHFASSASVSLVRDILSLWITRHRKVKSLVHFRFGRIPEIFEQRNWEYKLLDRVISLADKIVVIDQKSYNTLINEGYRNIELLPNPLTPAISDIINECQAINREERKLLFVGNNIVTKGVVELIEACKSIPNIRLKMIGHITDEMRNDLIEQAGVDSKDWLEIAGEQDFETTIKEMLSCGVFVLPSYTEGFPNVIIESMACGCPVVTTCVGAIPEMLDIENGDNYGLCIEPKNVEQLKTAIEKMLDDRVFAIQCGNNAQKRVNALYSMSKIWEQMEGIWEGMKE